MTITKFPPVKNPSGQEVNSYIDKYDGKPGVIQISNEVNGKFHFKSCPPEFWMTIEEFDDVRKKLTEVL